MSMGENVFSATDGSGINVCLIQLHFFSPTISESVSSGGKWTLLKDVGVRTGARTGAGTETETHGLLVRMCSMKHALASVWPWLILLMSSIFRYFLWKSGATLAKKLKIG